MIFILKLFGKVIKIMSMKELHSTGRGVKIAVIDSGISNHSAINSSLIIDGKSIIYNKDSIDISNEFNDEHGHGTGVAGILCHEAPDANFYILKVLDNNKGCGGNALIKALEIALEMDVDIINLSLGTENMIYEERLKKLCNEAYNKNTYMVAASNNSYKFSLPYAIPHVFKVLPGTLMFNNKIYHIEDEFLAQATPQMVPWINNSYALMGGSSFAAPRISASLSKLIEIHGKVTCKEMMQLLKNHSIKLENKNLINKKNFCYITSRRNISSDNCNLYKLIFNLVQDFLSVNIQQKPLWQQVINNSNSYHILKTIENNLNINIDYQAFNLFDFYNISSLTNKINAYFN